MHSGCSFKGLQKFSKAVARRQGCGQHPTDFLSIRFWRRAGARAARLPMPPRKHSSCRSRREAPVGAAPAVPGAAAGFPRCRHRSHREAAERHLGQSRCSLQHAVSSVPYGNPVKSYFTPRYVNNANFTQPLCPESHLQTFIWRCLRAHTSWEMILVLKKTLHGKGDD